MKLDLEAVQKNVQAASTHDLMDRLTFYRAGMEPEALEIIGAELAKRGVTSQQIEEWGPQPDEEYIWNEDGTVAKCSFCHRPARRSSWAWHRLWGKLPIFPRIFRYCEHHDPEENDSAQENSPT